MCLNKHSLEKIDLEKKTKQMIDKVDDQQQIIIKLFKEKENVMMDNDNLSLQIEQQSRTLKYLDKERSLTLSLNKSNTMSDYKPDSNDTTTTTTNINNESRL